MFPGYQVVVGGTTRSGISSSNRVAAGPNKCPTGVRRSNSGSSEDQTLINSQGEWGVR